MVILIVVFVLLFGLLLLAMPVVVTAKVRVSPIGAVVRGSATLFGVLSIPVKARIHLFHPPFFTLYVFGKSIPLAADNDTLRIDNRSVIAERIDLGVTLGVAQDGARTVQLLGTLKVLASLMLPLVFRRVTVTPYPSFSHEMLRLRLEIVGLVFPLFLLRPKSRIKKGALTKDNGKQTSEKRYSHVPC